MPSKCKVCSSDALELNSELLRVVCTNCGTISEDIGTMIHHEVDAPTSTYGLKCVGRADPHNPQDVIVFKPSDSLTGKPSVKPEYKEGSGSQSPQYNPLTGGQARRIRGVAHGRRENLRSWRVSEAFAVLLRLQLNYFIDKHLPPQSDFSNRLREVTKKLWINYLSVTGELGGDLWAVAFRRVVRATQLEQRSRLSFLFYRAREYKDGAARLRRLFGCNNEFFSNNVLRSFKEKIGTEPYYAGWSGFYKPNENDAANNPFSAFEPEKENEELNDYLDQMEVEAASTTVSDVESEYSDIDQSELLNNSSKRPSEPAVRKPRGAKRKKVKEEEDEDYNEEVHSQPSTSSSLPSLSTRALRKRRFERSPPSVKASSGEPVNLQLTTSEKLLTEAHDLSELAKLYKTLIADKLLIAKQARRNMFWHGQMAKDDRYRLLEFNLGLIFIASLLTSTVLIDKPAAAGGEKENEPSDTRWTYPRRKKGRTLNIDPFQRSTDVAVCQGELFTLSDLSALCLDRDNFPYLQASKWVTPPFVAYSTLLQAYFKRIIKPDPHDLCLVVKQLIFMLGITTRPKLPISSLVHRYLRMTSLPPEAHRLADALLRKLARGVAEKSSDKIEEGSFYLLPLERYLRPEVFAMAVVTVTVRLLLKLDGKFENCWSNVAKYLAASPAVSQRLAEVLDRRQLVGSEEHFDWSTWVCELPNEGPSMREHRRRFRKGDAALGTALSFEQVMRTARTADEFLGAQASFNPEEDLGWGEVHGKTTALAEKRVKISLTDVLSEMIGDMSYGGNRTSRDITNGDEDDPGQTSSASEARQAPCKSCQHFAEHAIFSRSDRETCNKWSKRHCDALVAAHEFIRRQGITAKNFLAQVFPQDSKQPNKGVYKDWLYILKHFDAYDPISKAILRSHQHEYSTELPQAVRDFLDLHAQRMIAFFAGKRISCDSTFPAPAASGESPAVDGTRHASLHWFLDAASRLCEARPIILTREVLCVESLLNLCPTDKLHVQTENNDVALASYFDFSPPN